MSHHSSIHTAGQVCLRIVTGTVWMLPGDLEVQVDQGTGGGSLVVATGEFAPGSTVLDACYPDVVGVTTRGLSNDGWVGSVFFSTDGGATYHPGHCSDCTVGSDTSSLVVDGNLDPREPRTHCSNGVLCHIQSGEIAAAPSPSHWPRPTILSTHARSMLPVPCAWAVTLARGCVLRSLSAVACVCVARCPQG